MMFVKKAFQLLFCYCLAWTLVEFLMSWCYYNMFLHDFWVKLLIHVIGFLDIGTGIAAMNFAGIHLPLFLLAALLLRKKPSGWLIAASISLASLIAPAHWVGINYLEHGYDASCDPDAGLFGAVCGLDPHTKISFSLADVVTGLLVGSILTRAPKRLTPPAAEAAEDLSVWPPAPKRS